MGFIPIHDHFGEIISIAPVRVRVCISFEPSKAVIIFLCLGGQGAKQQNKEYEPCHFNDRYLKLFGMYVLLNAVTDKVNGRSDHNKMKWHLIVVR